MKILPNGNIEITIQLMPTAYAALTEVKARDKLSPADAVNLALLTLDTVSQEVTKAGKPLSDAPESDLDADLEHLEAIDPDVQAAANRLDAVSGQILARRNCGGSWRNHDRANDLPEPTTGSRPRPDKPVGSAEIPWRRPRLRHCVEQWPGATEGDYDPRCCRFPKSCSADVYDDEQIEATDLEGPNLDTCQPCLHPGALHGEGGCNAEWFQAGAMQTCPCMHAYPADSGSNPPEPREGR